MLTPAVFNIQMERTHCAPWGLLSGKDGLANRITIRRADGSIVEPRNGKLVSFPIQEGDVYVVESGGGGGSGDPLQRDPARVLADVRAGYVSRQSAECDYGVVLTLDGSAVDEAATGRSRSR